MELGLTQEPEIENGDIKLTLERAKFSDRFFASFVDGVIINTPIQLLGRTLVVLLAPIYIILYSFLVPPIVYLWYFSYYAYKNNGQTLGKKWNKIRIVRLDGNNLSLGHFVVRELVKSGGVIIAYVLLGKIGALCWLVTYLLALTKNKRALHDIIVGTQVIKAEK